jgi:hypothetical protein
MSPIVGKGKLATTTTPGGLPHPPPDPPHPFHKSASATYGAGGGGGVRGAAVLPDWSWWSVFLSLNQDKDTTSRSNPRRPVPEYKDATRQWHGPSQLLSGAGPQGFLQIFRTAKLTKTTQPNHPPNRQRGELCNSQHPGGCRPTPATLGRLALDINENHSPDRTAMCCPTQFVSSGL